MLGAVPELKAGLYDVLWLKYLTSLIVVAVSREGEGMENSFGGVTSINQKQQPQSVRVTPPHLHKQLDYCSWRSQWAHVNLDSGGA